MTKSLAMVTLAVAALVVAAEPRAEARPQPPKIALTAIDGDDSGKVTDAVVEALDGDDLSVISQRVVNKAVDKLGVDTDKLSDKQAKKLSKEVDADALAIGKYGKAGGNKYLHFTLYIHGKKARGFKVTFNNAKSDRFRVKLRDKLLTKIQGETGDAAGGDDEEVVSDKEKGGDKDKEKVKGGDDEEDPIGKGDKKKKADKKAVADKDEGDEGDDEGEKKHKKKHKKSAARGDDEEVDEEVEPGTMKAPLHSANRAAARVDVGASFKNRGLTWNSRANFPEGPKNFKNTPVPGARFEAELYPLGFQNPKSVAAGLGIAVEYDKTLVDTLHSSDQPAAPIKANQQSFSVGARFRIVLGGSAMAPSITLGVGYGKRRFTTDRSQLDDPAKFAQYVPDTNYSVVDPGLDFRIPLVPAVALTFGGRALIVTDAGPIQMPSSYGRAKVFGARAAGGLDIILGKRFAIRIEGEFAQVGFAFTGTGDYARNLDKDPDTKDVGGMTDRSIGGSATLGVVY